MLKLRKVYLYVLILPNSALFAGTMGATSIDCSMPWFLEFGTGVSWSNTAKINLQPELKNLAPNNGWTDAVNSYNSGLGSVPIYMAGIGYTVNPLLKIDANYAFRGIYKYNNHLISKHTGTANPLPDNTRYFNLTSNSLLFNASLFAKGLEDRKYGSYLIKDMGRFGYIQPTVGAGIGVSYNTVSNFHTIIDGTYYNTSVMQDATIASFAWQLDAGFDWQFTDRFSVDIGYRYFSAGRFNSNDALVTRLDTSSSTYTPKYTTWKPAWLSSLTANELFITARVAI